MLCVSRFTCKLTADESILTNHEWLLLFSTSKIIHRCVHFLCSCVLSIHITIAAEIETSKIIFHVDLFARYDEAEINWRLLRLIWLNDALESLNRFKYFLAGRFRFCRRFNWSEHFNRKFSTLKAIEVTSNILVNFNLYSNLFSPKILICGA